MLFEQEINRVGYLSRSVPDREHLVEAILALKKEKNAVINVAHLPTEIMVDETKLRQVFQSLITNGLKFMPTNKSPEIDINGILENGFWKFCNQFGFHQMMKMVQT